MISITGAPLDTVDLMAGDRISLVVINTEISMSMAMAMSGRFGLFNNLNKIFVNLAFMFVNEEIADFYESPNFFFCITRKES